MWVPKGAAARPSRRERRWPLGWRRCSRAELGGLSRSWGGLAGQRSAAGSMFRQQAGHMPGTAQTRTHMCPWFRESGTGAARPLQGASWGGAPDAPSVWAPGVLRPCGGVKGAVGTPGLWEGAAVRLRVGAEAPPTLVADSGWSTSQRLCACLGQGWVASAEAETRRPSPRPVVPPTA